MKITGKNGTSEKIRIMVQGKKLTTVKCLYRKKNCNAFAMYLINREQNKYQTSKSNEMTVHSWVQL